VSRQLFRRIKAQRLLLEYDDARSGSFEPLRDVPDDRIVVLGLVTTKKANLESMQELTERIDEASRFISKDRLALSPQCGFASSVIGNCILPHDQRQKLALVVNTARTVWDAVQAF
jgi:5-methyltetrahydropteroyltriglutamate--homocysteine methyltransferase